MKVGYWGIKGRAYMTRCLLHYAGIEFEDVLYGSEADPGANAWFAELKPELAKSAYPIKCPSIPYIIDQINEDEKPIHIFQSMAVIKYAGRKANFCAETEQGQQIEDIFWGFYAEQIDAAGKIVAIQDKDEKSAAAKKWGKEVLEKLQVVVDLHVKTGYEFLTGEKISWADFVLFDLFEKAITYAEDASVGAGEKLKMHREKLLGNEKLAEYVEAVKDVPHFP